MILPTCCNNCFFKHQNKEIFVFKYVIKSKDLVDSKKLIRDFPDLRYLQLRHVARSENLGGQVVMRRAATVRRRLLICQNLGGRTPPPLLTCLQPLTLAASETSMTSKAHFSQTSLVLMISSPLAPK